ncbi:MAG: UDP-3-O-(3-hydroxymyristoyl)glucosamine N-acyltransferase [candidate division Zixibacteria bacterium]|nr:UDP-3-O-(3-hydroxymyristoyl)glucosamine N-acyltransferase [candidate division Zixibacteria bacterium]
MVSYQLSKIAEKVEGKIVPEGSDCEISGIRGLQDANADEITFLSNRKYIPLLKDIKAAAIIVDESFTEELPIPRIIVNAPHLAFRETLVLFHGERPQLLAGISKNSSLGENFKPGKDIHIGNFVSIGDNVVIGDKTSICPQTTIGDNTIIGRNCFLHPGVTIMNDTEIHDNVIIHAGVVIGSDGFGYVVDGAVRLRIPQVGRVVIEDDVEIGANTTIDRATMGETRIRRGTKIDNLVQIAHNVNIGEDCSFSAQVGISGSNKIGNRVILAGQVGLADHIEIGDEVMIAAQSGVHNNVPSKSILFGSPARNIRKQKRIEAIIGRLPEYINRIRAIEKKLSE